MSRSKTTAVASIGAGAVRSAGWTVAAPQGAITSVPNAALHAEMWAQDAMAMYGYGYVASPAAAGMVNPLASPAQITSLAGHGTHLPGGRRPRPWRGR